MTRAATEAQEQAAYLDWLKVQWPVAYAMTFAPINGAQLGGKKKFAQVAALKKTGLREGVPDLIMLFPVGDYHGMAIEMKRVKRPAEYTESQQAWAERLTFHGYWHALCRGADEAIRQTNEYMRSGSDG